MGTVTAISNHPKFKCKHARAWTLFMADWIKVVTEPQPPRISLHTFNPMVKRFTYHPDQSRTPHVPE